MSGHRQAAVALYSLAASDQGAILAELPERDQDILRGYLAELAELGFDKAANNEVAVAPQLVAPAAQAQQGGTRRQLRRASAHAMLSILRQEPASLVAQFLALERWDWAAELLELLPPQRRAQVIDAGRNGFPPAPARDAFLLDAVGAALAALPAPAAPAGVRGLPVRLARMVPWTR